MPEQWTDWINHDGKGNPAELLEGMQYQTESMWYGEGIKNLGTKTLRKIGGKSWDWSNYPEYTMVLRYRIRKPDALQKMIERAEALTTVKQKEIVQ